MCKKINLIGVSQVTVKRLGLSMMTSCIHKDIPIYPTVAERFNLLRVLRAKKNKFPPININIPSSFHRLDREGDNVVMAAIASLSIVPSWNKFRNENRFIKCQGNER